MYDSTQVSLGYTSHSALHSGNGTSPRWQLGARYGDWSLVLEVQHDAVETVFTPLIMIDGEAYRVVTPAERDELVATAKAHGDVYDETNLHVESLRGGLWEAFAEMKARFNAARFIVQLRYTL
jgi:hypothetical protein